VLGFKKQKNRQKKTTSLDRQLAETDARLALLKVQLAAHMVKLAGQTNDIAPLKQAEEALSAARNYYTFETTPREVGMVQVALGDMLMKLGRAQSDKSALSRARDAYRAGITLASMHGDDSQRDALRAKIKLTESYLGKRQNSQALFRVA